jgi:hypothetical protein
MAQGKVRGQFINPAKMGEFINSPTFSNYIFSKILKI